MVIKVLHIHGCPSLIPVQRNLEEALALLGIEEVIETVVITTSSQSLAEDFGGSPTITQDGRDIFEHPYGVTVLACRVYSTPKGLKVSALF